MTTTTTSTFDVASAASTAETVMEGVMKFEPFVATIAGAAIPGAAPIVAMVQPMVAMAAPFIENALKALSAHNNGDAFSALIQLIQHVTPGHPNSPVLDSTAAPAASPAPTVVGS